MSGHVRMRRDRRRRRSGERQGRGGKARDECPLSEWRMRKSNLQPVTRVGREERAAEHQDAPQNIFLGHLEREGGEAGES